MKITENQTKTYLISEIKGLDPITVYVSNYENNSGKIVIECYGSTWSTYFGSMGEGNDIESFILKQNNDYILNRLIKKAEETDFDKINAAFKEFNIGESVSSDVEVALQSESMETCFGPYWHMEIPSCASSEYLYAERILNAVKDAFSSLEKTKKPKSNKFSIS